MPIRTIDIFTKQLDRMKSRFPSQKNKPEAGKKCLRNRTSTNYRVSSEGVRMHRNIRPSKTLCVHKHPGSHLYLRENVFNGYLFNERFIRPGNLLPALHGAVLMPTCSLEVFLVESALTL